MIAGQLSRQKDVFKNMENGEDVSWKRAAPQHVEKINLTSLLIEPQSYCCTDITIRSLLSLVQWPASPLISGNV